jgi:membrane protein YqaA with SNARE-associated domain
MTAYLALFVTAFVAATVLPAQSETVLVGLIVNDSYSVPALVAVASVGNTLGSVVNWFLGRGVESLKDRQCFPVRPVKLARAQSGYQRYGKWSRLGSWLPVVGDAITVVAGIMREPLPVFVLLVGLAKTVRYAILAAITTGIV